jgi:hypothetical protein
MTAAAASPAAPVWWSRLDHAIVDSHVWWDVADRCGVAPSLCQALYIKCVIEADRDSRRLDAVIAEFARWHRIALEVVRAIVAAFGDAGGMITSLITRLSRRDHRREQIRLATQRYRRKKHRDHRQSEMLFVFDGAANDPEKDHQSQPFMDRVPDRNGDLGDRFGNGVGAGSTHHNHGVASSSSAAVDDHRAITPRSHADHRLITEPATPCPETPIAAPKRREESESDSSLRETGKNDEGASQRCALLTPEQQERRAKRLNRIKTMRRWVQHSPDSVAEDRAARLQLLDRAELAVDNWSGRLLADKRAFEALLVQVERRPLDAKLTEAARQVERGQAPDPGFAAMLARQGWFRSADRRDGRAA